MHSLQVTSNSNMEKVGREQGRQQHIASNHRAGLAPVMVYSCTLMADGPKVPHLPIHKLLPRQSPGGGSSLPKLIFPNQYAHIFILCSSRKQPPGGRAAKCNFNIERCVGS